jgi:uncharacterized protein (UPF0303 family)
MSDKEAEARRLEPFLQQENELQFAEFSNDQAFALGLRMAEVARKEGKPLTLDICRNGQQLFHLALPGTSADNDFWVRRKNNVVNRYGHSSLYVGTLFRAQGTTFEEKSRLDADQFAAHGGGFPVIVRGVGVVGTVTVSGLPQVEDHEFVVRMVREFLAASRRP